MTQQEKEKIIEVINNLFDLNNKALYLAKEYPGVMITRQILEQISKTGYQCFNELNTLIQNSKPEVMTVDKFVHSPIMGG